MLTKPLCFITSFVAIFFSVFLSGCSSMPLPLSEDRINTELFASPDDLLNRVSQLKEGMTKEECFAVLSVSEKTANVERLSAPEIRNILYGNELRVTSYADTELFKLRLAKHDGYKVPFLFKKQGGALALPAHILFLYQGYDLTTVLLFEEGRLINVRLAGVAHINKQEKRFIFSVIGAPAPFK
jgi:hypothetical protein